MSTSKNRTKKNTAKGGTPKAKDQRPVVLILEGLSGAVSAVARAGGKGKSVNPRSIAEVQKALDGHFDALLLTGGGDVDPRLYGERPHKKVYGVSETRDLTEWYALDVALERNVPVLGICRGSQLMAVHNGGKLRQHISGHSGIDHPAFTEEGSTFRETVGEKLLTVSLHHQVVKRTGDGFRVAARAAGGSIEAIESKDGRCLGVQFHPEMNYYHNEQSRSIFRWLVLEAAQRAGLPTPAEGSSVSRWDSKPTVTRKAKPKARKAGQQQLPGMSRRGGPVNVTWQCPRCSIRFDKVEDRDDHVMLLHSETGVGANGKTLEAEVEAWAAELRAEVSGDGAWGEPDDWELGLEPPPGHPDWD